MKCWDPSRTANNIGALVLLVLVASCQRTNEALPIEPARGSAMYEFRGSLAESSHFSVDLSGLEAGAKAQVQRSGSPLIELSNGVQLTVLVATPSNRPVWSVLDETFAALLGRPASRVVSKGEDLFVTHKLTIGNPKLLSTEIDVKRWDRRSGDHFTLSYWSPKAIVDTSDLEKRLVDILKTARCLP